MAEKIVIAVVLQPEIWRPVVGYEGLYEVSSLGRIKSLPRNGTLGGVLAQTPVRGGYLSVHLSKRDRQSRIAVHRIVATAFHGECPEGYECAHLDGSRNNNRPENLRWVTAKENQGHRRAHGTMCLGERNGSALLAPETALEIRRLSDESKLLPQRAAGRLSQPQIANLFGVSRQTVSAIGRREIWGHI